MPYCIRYSQLTRCECVVPPVGLAEKGLQVIGSAAHNYIRWRDEGPDQQTGSNRPTDDAQSLEQGCISDFHSLRRTNSENHRNPVGEISEITGICRTRGILYLTARSSASELHRSVRILSHAAKCGRCRCTDWDWDTSQCSLK